MWFMCKNKLWTSALVCLAATMSLTACSAPAGLVTDTGSGKQQEIPVEDYLDTKVLTGKEQKVDDIYQVITLEKGSFEEPALRQVLRRSYINVPSVQLSMEGFKGTFGEYVAEYVDYVEAGDVIVTIYTEVDEIAVEEAKLKLQRLRERYQEAEAKLAEDMQELTDKGNAMTDEYEYRVHRIQVQQRQLDWEYEKANYLEQIEDAQKTLKQLTKVGSVYEVKAPMSGVVFYNERYRAGQEIEDGDYICHIMNSNEVYTTTDAQAEFFQYGMDLAFENTYGNATSTVVNGGPWLLYGNLDTGRAIFRLEMEQDISQINPAALNNLTLSGNLTSMDDVIVIPKKAVEVEDETYYVTVLLEDGTLRKTEFIPGGDNTESYWVLQGLDEGMQIVYN